MKALLLIFAMLSSTIYSQNFELNIHLKNDSTFTISLANIQKIIFEDLTGIEAAEALPQAIKAFQLLQNYPNPFNPATTIAYQIPHAAKVNVSVFDISGKLIKELLNETQTEGQHQVTWDGTNLDNTHVASGIYIYTVKSNGVVLSKQMILLK